MNVAYEESEKDASSGTIVMAEEQTAGRGRSNRSWASPPRTNLYFTLILRPKQTTELLKLNFATAIAIAKTARSLGVEKAGVKWPNDVWVDRKKLAGILTDSSITGNSIVALVGVGLNVNELFDSYEKNELKDIATSLKSCLNKTVSREIVLATFCNELEELLLQPFSDVLAIYKEVDVLIGESIWVMPKFSPKATKKPGRALNIADDGTLVVRMDETGEVVNLTGEEVSIRLQ